ncbi:hypothetical protein PSHT_13237 [Puccinia striiformis]|uniref:Uncharacterized protein n=1 Tax=Puccinia striiformis TaxID=27350 RepID=A0A2S4USM3_9BASI|nr:hypothetical protein PSHT_13237 [Puccinia striiformis]
MLYYICIETAPIYNYCSLPGRILESSIPLPSIQEVDNSFICVKTNQDEPSTHDSP